MLSFSLAKMTGGVLKSINYTPSVSLRSTAPSNRELERLSDFKYLDKHRFADFLFKKGGKHPALLV